MLQNNTTGRVKMNITNFVYEYYEIFNIIIYLYSNSIPSILPAFTENCTVSNLFNSYCMHLHSCPMWRCYKKLQAIHVEKVRAVSGNSILKLIMTYYIILITVYL